MKAKPHTYKNKNKYFLKKYSEPGKVSQYSTDKIVLNYKRGLNGNIRKMSKLEGGKKDAYCRNKVSS